MIPDYEGIATGGKSADESIILQKQRISQEPEVENDGSQPYLLRESFPNSL